MGKLYIHRGDMMMNYWEQNEKNIYVAAHRGWCAKYPENTILAFEKAIELDVDQLELDIRITADDELVVIHDHTVDRTTNGTGKVCDMTLAELKELDAGIIKGEEFAGCRIPTFIEFMELIKDLPRMTIDFELKEYPEEIGDKAYEICDRVLKIVDDYGYTDRCVINTFSYGLHEYIHNKYGTKYKQHVYYPIHTKEHNGDITTDVFEYGYCVCMFGDSANHMASKAEFEEMRSKYGIQPWAGAGVKDESGVDETIECGAPLITCNNPDVILDILRKKGYHK